MTTLITGGAGFVGLNIAEKLLASGQDVVMFDRSPQPTSLGLELDGLPGRLAWLTGSVTDMPSIVIAIKTHHVTHVVHGAAITAGITREATQASDIAAVNLLGTINVLEASVRCEIPRVVQLGTGSVYGPTVKREGLLDEERDLPKPESLYGITKYAAELTALRYRTTRNLNITVARLGVVFGRYEYDTGVRDTLSAPLTLARMAQDGEHAKVFDGLPDDWVYASDVATAIHQLLQHSRTPSPVYHVSTGGAWSIQDWCERLKAAYPGFTYELVKQQDQANVGKLTPSKRPPFSIERITRDIGYRPAYLAEQAFEDYHRWHRLLAK